MKIPLVYVFTGTEFPMHVFDNLYQFFFWNPTDGIEVYILTEEEHLSSIRERIGKMDLVVPDAIKLVPIALVSSRAETPVSVDRFPSEFFFSAYHRLHLLRACISHFRLKNVFHIENDVMLYTSLESVFAFLSSLQMTDKLIVVQDAPTRALASILFTPSDSELNKFLEFSVAKLSEHPSVSYNEMDLLGIYPDKYSFPNTLDDPNLLKMGYFDGACIGQFLGGVHDIHIPSEYKTDPFSNLSKGFVNETSTLKPDKIKIWQQTKETQSGSATSFYFTVPHLGALTDKRIPIQSLHMHSKNLYEYASGFGFRYAGVITGERILAKCHFVVCTMENFLFHKNLTHFQKNILVVDENFTNVHSKKLSECILEANSPVVRVGLYTHTMRLFFAVLAQCDDFETDVKLDLYIHNSDNSFDLPADSLPKCVRQVFAQNCMTPPSENVHLLPIGLQNSMWNPTNISALFSVMTQTYTLKKTKPVIVMHNENTFPYRAKVSKVIQDTKFTHIHRGKPFADYLREMAEHRFALCVRGNGIDTHRFWEALYLNVIPVIINNQHTKCDAFVEHLRFLNLPFYEIRHLTMFCKTHNEDFFSEELYQGIMKRCSNWRPKLDISFYFR